MSWLEEKQSAWLYRQAAQAEADQRISKLFTTLAEAAEQQAAIWKPEATDVFVPGLRARIVALLLKRVSPRRLRPALPGSDPSRSGRRRVESTPRLYHKGTPGESSRHPGER